MMASIKQKEYERKREQLLKAFEEGGSDYENSVASDEAIRALVIDLLALKKGLDSSDSAVRAKLWNGASAQMQSWDPDEPELTHSAKLLRLLALTRDGSSTNYADNLQNHRNTEERARQAQRASNPHRKNRFDVMLHGWISGDPSLDECGALDLIRGEIGNGIIYDVTEDHIEIYPFDDSEENYQVKKVARSGLRARIRRIKADL